MTADNFICVIKLKSSLEEEAARMQPGSNDTTVLCVPFLVYWVLCFCAHFVISCHDILSWAYSSGFNLASVILHRLPESSGDEILMEILDSKGASQGRVNIPIASISDDPVRTSSTLFNFRDSFVEELIILRTLCQFLTTCFIFSASCFATDAEWASAMVWDIQRWGSWVCGKGPVIFASHHRITWICI